MFLSGRAVASFSLRGYQGTNGVKLSTYELMLFSVFSMVLGHKKEERVGACEIHCKDL